MSNVINIRRADEMADARFTEIHLNAPDINGFVASMGTPDEWLGSAMLHVKCILPCGHSAGTVTVSAAALSLMVMKLEELLYGGSKIVLPIED